MGRWVDGWLGGWVDGWVDDGFGGCGWVDEWVGLDGMGGWVDGWELFYVFSFLFFCSFYFLWI